MSFLSSILSILTGGSTTCSLFGNEVERGEEVGVFLRDCSLSTGEEGWEGAEASCREGGCGGFEGVEGRDGEGGTWGAEGEEGGEMMGAVWGGDWHNSSSTGLL